MTIRACRLVLAAMAAMGVLCADVALAGQTPDPIPPGTITLGPLRITPSLVVRDMGVDANVFNEAVNPKSDFTATIVPRADLIFTMRRIKLGYSAVTEYVYFHEYRSEGGVNTSSQARIDVDFGGLKPYATVQGLNTKSRITSEVDARARYRDLLYGAGLSFKLASRTTVTVAGQQGKIAYDEDAPDFRGVDLKESLDGRRRAIDVGFGIALTPLTTFGLSLTREEQRFVNERERDSNSWRVSPTFTFSPTGVLTGSATVGYRRFDVVSPDLVDYSGLVSIVNIGATIYARHQVQARLLRDVQYSYDTETAYYLSTGGTVTWTYLLFGPIDVRGTGGRTRMDYSVAGEQLGDDTLITYGGGVGYRFSTRARLGVNGEWSRRESALAAERTYRNHRFFAGLTWGIQP